MSVIAYDSALLVLAAISVFAVIVVLRQWRRSAKAAEAVISESQNRMHLVMRSAQIARWDVDFKTGLVDRSEIHDKLYGYEENLPAWTWTHFTEHIHPQDREGVLAHINKVASSGYNDYAGEFRILTRDKMIRWVSSRAVFRRDEQGNAIGASGVIWDVTDLKQAQATAEQASQAKSQFLANISHELRTPLGAIIGFHELLKDADLSTRDRDRYFAIIDRNGQTLSRLIDDLLELSRIESGAVRLEKNDVDLRQLVTDIVLSIESTLDPKRDVRIAWSMSDVIPGEVQTDILRVRQIVTNLLSNAVKFTHRGEISLEILADAHSLVFNVIDSGLGIPKNVQEQLFQPFQQGDASITRKFGGSGLGLALSRQLARLLGGDVVLVSSDSGRGSHFRFTLPLVVSSVSEPTLPRVTAGPGNRELFGLRILVVDDSLDNQILIQRALSKRGAAIDLASNGMEAIEAAEAELFDVILMDMQMPVMDGATAVRHLRSMGNRIPIIALTAHAMASQRVACLEAGCNEHVAKPVDFRDLASRILRLAQENQSALKKAEPDVAESSEIQLTMNTL